MIRSQYSCCLLLWLFGCWQPVSGFSLNTQTVLVSGANGRTGRLVLQRLLDDPRYDPIALVRSPKSAKQLVQSGFGLNQVAVCDITAKMDDLKVEPGAALIVCTSAVPRIRVRSLASALLRVPWNVLRRKSAMDFSSLSFGWKYGQPPELVDYHGQVAQFELARRLGVSKVVVVSSMGGTDPDNFLNQIGKRPDGTGDGDILLWKQKAEHYLMKSGLGYAILHPGGLNDAPDGVEALVLDKDDVLMQHKKRTISRGDVANLCVAALSLKDNCSVDCISMPVPEGTPVESAESVLRRMVQSTQSVSSG